jgi:Ca-activated chloride channel homolog
MRRIGEIIDEIDLKGKNDELVKELVELSTKHGILTPYTSFLADDGAGGYGNAGRISNVYRDADTDREVVVQNVQNTGNETLFKRGDLWIANNARNIDPEKDEAKIRRVKRFSDEYFKLVRENTPQENTILAAQQEGEQLLCVFRGQAYRIE